MRNVNSNAKIHRIVNALRMISNECTSVISCLNSSIPVDSIEKKIPVITSKINKFVSTVNKYYPIISKLEIILADLLSMLSSIHNTFCNIINEMKAYSHTKYNQYSYKIGEPVEKKQGNSITYSIYATIQKNNIPALRLSKYKHPINQIKNECIKQANLISNAK